MAERIAVVVPATDSPPTLERCLAALRAGERPPDAVIVVDSPPGAGPAAARNAGAARADAELLAFVDSDVVVHADALARVAAAFAADPGLDAVFGSYDDAPEAHDPVSSFRNLLHHRVHHDAAGPAVSFWAGLGAIRREAFLAAGGFDAVRYPRSSIEDVELGARLAAAGARIELDPAIQGTHLKRWTLASMLRTDFARRGVPWVELAVERPALRRALNLGVRHRAGALASVLALAALARGRPRTALAAIAVDGWLNRPLLALLRRRRGTLAALAGLPLLALHRLASAAALLVGIARLARGRGPGARRGGGG